MIKRIVIAGCRNFNDYDCAKNYIDNLIRNIRKNNEIIIMSGGCRGADLLGERYATENGFKIERYTAQWNKYGKSAGPKRNKTMAENCDCVICFWDGKSNGTKSMIKYAQELNKPLRIKFIR